MACSMQRGDGERTCRTCGTSITRHRPTCSPECAGTWAEHHVWNRARLRALDDSGLICARCGRPTLQPEVHHVIPVQGHGGYRAGCQHHQSNLLVLCGEPDRGCHREEDRWRRRVERIVGESGEIYWAVQLSLPGV